MLTGASAQAQDLGACRVSRKQKEEGKVRRRGQGVFPLRSQRLPESMEENPASFAVFCFVLLSTKLKKKKSAAEANYMKFNFWVTSFQGLGT